MKTPHFALVLLLGHTIACQSEREVQLQASAQHEDPALDVAREWLLGDCITESPRALEERMQQLGPQLRPIFVHAMEAGPPPSLLLSYREKAVIRYRESQTFLSEGADLGLPPAVRRRIEEDTFDEFWDRARTDLSETYRARAVLGLGVIGGPGVPELLEGLTQSEGPLSLPARYALAHMVPSSPGR